MKTAKPNKAQVTEEEVRFMAHEHIAVLNTLDILSSLDKYSAVEEIMREREKSRAIAKRLPSSQKGEGK